ncbi:hypothetical protein DAH66_12725 [Sphingomonas koreensis]|uniref:Uncharacterized protein n=1 Tax=Sphingomonas koreensis TaxID=93064 RepID=A0A430G2C2_9SPHN|nr:hypothetical protein [Sphingomonas koreensis]RSY83127.1 hypothetical protein DAH66_12725 [Sphingomonas koreensis]
MTHSRLFNVRQQIVHGVDLTIADFKTAQGLGSVSVESEVYAEHGMVALEEQLEMTLTEIAKRQHLTAPRPRHAEL